MYITINNRDLTIMAQNSAHVDGQKGPIQWPSHLPTPIGCNWPPWQKSERAMIGAGIWFISGIYAPQHFQNSDSTIQYIYIYVISQDVSWGAACILPSPKSTWPSRHAAFWDPISSNLRRSCRWFFWPTPSYIESGIPIVCSPSHFSSNGASFKQKLVGVFSPPPWKIWVRQIGSSSQLLGKKKMFQSTNQEKW